MNRIRTLLEEIKKFDDVRRKAEGNPPEDEMILYPPAAPAAVQKLLNGGWSHPLPPSFGDFLLASNGVSKFRGAFEFLSTDSKRQKSVRAVVERKIEQQYINLRALFVKVDEAVIEKWESEPKNFYIANHAVIAATEMGSLLFYDSRTRNAKGEMNLCWKSATKARIEQRYDNIEKYLEAALQEAREEAGVQ
jgi:hypothetical protein